MLVMAVPAHRGIAKVLQPDGSYLSLRLHGDEWLSFNTTADGYSVVKDSKGYYVYAQLDEGCLLPTEHVAHDAPERSAAENQWLAGVRKFQAPAMSERNKELKTAEVTRRSATLEKRRAAQYDYTKFRGLVILVEFNKLSFKTSNPQTAFSNQMNQVGYSDGGATGSVRDYYVDNSMGKFTPVFDVYGPVQVSNTYDYYGNDVGGVWGNDYAPEVAFAEACKKLDGQIDFSKYDSDGDGEVDVVFFYYAGFNQELDGGVPYIKDITYTGKMYEFNRQLPWEDDDNPGFGASYADEAGLQIAGNTFDYPFIHGQSLMALGRRFCSMSSAAFQADGAPAGIAVADIICGKQVTVPSGRPGASANRFQVFPEALRNSITAFTKRGGDVLVSGANIGTDIWSFVFPHQKDTTDCEKAKTFTKEVLGYKWITNYASKSAVVKPMRNKLVNGMDENLRVNFYNTPNEDIYCVETPDGLLPASEKSTIIMRYTDTHVGAAIAFDSGTYQVISMGFPLEVVKCPAQRTELMKTALEFFKKQ